MNTGRHVLCVCVCVCVCGACPSPTGSVNSSDTELFPCRGPALTCIDGGSIMYNVVCIRYQAQLLDPRSWLHIYQRMSPLAVSPGLFSPQRASLKWR